MEAKTALELWNDGVEDRLNLQLYHCDVESLLEGDLEPSPLRFYAFDSPDIILEGRVTPTLNLSNQLDSPTYEELFEQNWQLFEESDQELDSFCADRNVPEDMDLMESPKVICSVMPEPTCLTRVIQEMVMYPPSVKKVPKKRKKKGWARHKKSRPPRTKVAMVSDDENDSEVVSEVQDPPVGTASRGDFQEFCQPKQPVASSSSSVRRRARGLPSSPNTASEVPSFAEHFGQYSDFFLSFFHHKLEAFIARCAVDWDYPRALFSMGGYEPEPVFRKLAPPRTRETFASLASAAQPLTPIALEQKKSATALGATNELSRKKRSASSNLSADFERVLGPRISVSRNLGLENLESIAKPAPRQNKRRRLVA